MTDNNKIIFNLIKKHFGYNDESLSYVESQLERHTSDKHIEDMFASAQDERLYFPIPMEYKERIDEGWVVFKKTFMDFASAYEMKYSDFVENKIVINKNSLKLKKAISAFYIKKRSEKVIKGNLSSRTANVSYIGKSLVDSELKECLINRTGSDTSIQGVMSRLLFKETSEGIFFVDLSGLSVYHGKNVSKTTFEMYGALRLLETLTVRTNPTNTIAILKSSDEEFPSIYYNKLSEGGLNFFRRSKITAEVYSRYFSKKFFMCRTNDVRLVKIWYLNQDNYLCSVLARINLENGDFDFEGETVSDIVVPNSPFSVVNKEKHSEFYFYNNEPKSVVKYISENGVNLKETSKDLSKYLRSTTQGTVFSNDFIFSFGKNGIDTFSSIDTESAVSEEVKKEIENDVSKKLDYVGTKSLPKNKDINVVISKNFADWFLCSTSETWSSCLNLESKHSAIHWQGLPALLGDKDRVMFYVTDGTKKSYNGIVVDKILTRTWGILDSKNVFNIIKFYPLELLGIKDLKGITNQKIYTIEPDFVSKNPIVPIYYSYSERFDTSSFIFQDKTTFVKMSDGYHIGFCPSNGYYSIVKDREKNSVSIKSLSLFDFTGGFNYLKETGKKIIFYNRSLSLSEEHCALCGSRIREGNQSHPYEDTGVICHSCFNDRFFTCSICHNTYNRGDTYYVEVNGECVCGECKEEHITTCDECGKLEFKKRLTTYYNADDERKDSCEQCFDKQELLLYEQCDKCGVFFHENVVEKHKFYVDYKEEHLCGKCIDELVDMKQEKFSFYV